MRGGPFFFFRKSDSTLAFAYRFHSLLAWLQGIFNVVYVGDQAAWIQFFGAFELVFVLVERDKFLRWNFTNLLQIMDLLRKLVQLLFVIK